MTDITSDTLGHRRRQRLGSLLAIAEREGATLQFWARTLALVAVEAFLIFFNKWNAGFLFSASSLLIFFLVGLLHYKMVQKGYNSPWLAYAFGTFDMIFITFLIVGRNPFSELELPLAMHLREAGFKFLLIFVCLSTLSLSPRLALWLGVTAAASWAFAVVWVIRQPGTIISRMPVDASTLGEWEHLYFDPNFVDVVGQLTNIVVMLIITGILALVVSRSRKLADDYIIAERARSNLARHFSPNVVDELASADEPFGPVRRQDIAVVFADIVGFTNYTEDHPAEQVFELLRQFHRRMEQVVFDHGGTVDNYIGDCIMATFGVPRAGGEDATRALRCSLAMVEAIDFWNGQRATKRMPPIDVRIGAQFGSVVLGAVGSERNLSFAVVGDTVNVASRLQNMCREFDADICVGQALMEAVARENSSDLLAAMIDCGPVQIRGRDGLVPVWKLPKVEFQIQHERLKA